MYEPAGHAWQVVVLGSTKELNGQQMVDARMLYVPDAQQTPAPGELYVPPAQPRQAAALLLSVMELYFPAAHKMHVEEAKAVVYEPGAQE